MAYGRCAAAVVAIAVSADVPTTRADTLRFSTLQVGVAPPAEPEAAKPDTAPAASARSSFRHTFGAERRGSEEARIAPRARLDARADVYLLSGVTSAATVRRLFPASEWHVVLSRQLALPAAERGSDRGTTGVAIRVSETIRVMRLDHVATDLGRPLRGEVATTAALLRVSGQSIWIVAVDLGGACFLDPPDVGSCRPQVAARERLGSWLAQRQADDAPILIAGPNTDVLVRGSPADPVERTAISAAERSPPDATGTAELRLERRGAAAILASERRTGCGGATHSQPQIVLIDPKGTATVSERGWQVPAITGASPGNDEPCRLVLDVTLPDDLR